MKDICQEYVTLSYLCRVPEGRGKGLVTFSRRSTAGLMSSFWNNFPLKLPLFSASSCRSATKLTFLSQNSHKSTQMRLSKLGNLLITSQVMSQTADDQVTQRNLFQLCPNSVSRCQGSGDPATNCPPCHLQSIVCPLLTLMRNMERAS